jgi:hypothetical protein
MSEPKSITQQLADYIEKNLGKGYNLDSLKFSLRSQGYSKISIENAIELSNKKIAESIPPIKEKPKITYRILSQDNQPIYETISIPKKGFFQKLFGN